MGMPVLVILIYQSFHQIEHFCHGKDEFSTNSFRNTLLEVSISNYDSSTRHILTTDPWYNAARMNWATWNLSCSEGRGWEMSTYNFIKMAPPLAIWEISAQNIRDAPHRVIWTPMKVNYFRATENFLERPKNRKYTPHYPHKNPLISISSCFYILGRPKKNNEKRRKIPQWKTRALIKLHSFYNDKNI